MKWAQVWGMYFEYGKATAVLWKCGGCFFVWGLVNFLPFTREALQVGMLRNVPSMGVGRDTINRPTSNLRCARESAQISKQPSNTHQHPQARESPELHEGSQQPARTCDGSGRRQIPKPFFGAGIRACVVLSMVRGCPLSDGGDPRIMPAAPKNGRSKGFDQRERVAFSGHSFLKRVTAGVGARSSHPLPRIGIRGAVYTTPLHIAGSC